MLNDRWRSSRTWDYPLTRELDQGSRGPSAPPLSSLWSLLPSSPPEAAPRVQPWDAYAVLRLSELGTWLSPVKPSCICDGNQLRPLYKLLRFLQVGAESHSPCTTPHPPPTRLVRKFPCLLDLPPINLEGSASFFISPGPLWTGEIQITHLKLWRGLPTNNYTPPLLPISKYFYPNERNTCFHVTRPMGILIYVPFNVCF